MKDTQLYSQILGIQEPWKVTSVNVSLADDEVKVQVNMVAANLDARSADKFARATTGVRGAGAISIPASRRPC